MTTKKISDNGVAHCKRNGYYVQGIFQKYEKIFEQKKEKQNDKVFLNPIQRKMFRDLMYGTANYTPDELYKMNEDELITLIKRHRKTKRLIHILKCKKAYYIETKLLNLVFSHCQMGDKDEDWLLWLPKEYTLSKLKISTKEVIDFLIEREMLPINFYNL